MSSTKRIFTGFLQNSPRGSLSQNFPFFLQITIVILFLRGFICFNEDGAVGSSPPLPPKLLALFLDFVFDADANSFRNGLG